MQHLSMVIITVKIFGSEIEQKLSSWRIFQFSWNEKNYHTKNETGELFSIFDLQPFMLLSYSTFPHFWVLNQDF